MRFLKIFLVVFIALGMLACGESKSRRRSGKGRKPEASLPSKDAKVVFIIPGGAGALRVSLGILEALEKDVGSLDKYYDLVGGISGGALLAAAVVDKISLAQVKTELPGLLRGVFPELNNLGDKLIQEGFKLSELEAIYKEISTGSKTSLDLSGGNIEKTFGEVFKNAVKNSGKPAMSGKLLKLMDSNGALKPDIAALIAGYNPVNTTNALFAAIQTMLGSSAIDDAKHEKLIAYAAHGQKPVFITNTARARTLGHAYLSGASRLEAGLVVSSAIPKVIPLPPGLPIVNADGSAGTADLSDGFFVNNQNDPSAIFYEAFQKVFADQELLVVYVGNGAPTDSKFRKDKFDLRTGVGQIEVKGKKVTFAAIDTTIKDGQDEDLFNVAGFVDNKDLYDYMDKAVSKAKDGRGYKYVVKALKSARP